MSDEASGAVQGALPPREAPVSRSMADQRPAVRLTQVAGGQYVFTTQPSPTAMPALAQISSGALVSTNAAGGVTRIISISPSRGQLSTSSSSALRPSLTSQSIVNALTKSRSNSNGAAGGGGNVRVQLFTGDRKRAGGGEKQRDGYEGFAAKRRRVMNDRNVRSKIVKEKYMEHLVEEFQLEVGANVLDLHPIEKRPKTPQLYRYLKEKAIDPRDYVEDNVVASVPSATQASSLPGATVTSNVVSPIVAPKAIVESKSAVHKTKSLTPVSSQEQIVEKAKQEAYVVQRINELQKEGLWSERRLPKVQEMPRGKAHWDFLLEEMVWLAADFAQERKWKKAAAKKCARMVQKYFQDKASAAQRAEKAQEQHLKRIAAFCAKEIKNFWNNVEKLVEYKQNTRLEEKRKKALDQHLSFIVDQTEKYSQLLAEGMNKPTADSHPASEPPSRPHSRMSDDEFDPNNQSSTDDEETIAQAEVGEAEQKEEVEALQRESEMDFESFLSELPKDYLQNRDKIQLSASENSDEESEDDPPPSTSKPTKGDVDFEATSSSEDDEDTIQEQEQAEGDQNHAEELADLEAENEMSIEELRRKYSDLPVDDDSAMSVVDESDTSSGNDESDADMEVDSEENAEETEDVGLRALVDERVEDGEGEKTVNKNNDLINDAAAIAESIQPKGNTLSSTSVVTPVPFLLKLPLREYQHIGLDWLVTMFERKLNGILADEMGLGKTIQTIALLAHLACEKENWGPHLIIVPTSVMLNWEMECKKWCPAFKILTYYGTQKERKAKRTGWTKPNAFHICITSYKLVIQDHQSFRRKKWKYLILDEAQNIKNFKSQRWQLLLNFQTQQRLLLTGTPLQNNLMELWSLMHFLMPHVFQSHREFKEWFSNPVTGMIEGNSEYNESIIKRLHKVLRPFLLRRLKCEVEKQMPKKYEHIVICRLSKRQRFLYDDYMSRAKTKETLASGNLLSVINVLMQLRKVCNHPNLFEVRPTISPFQCEGITQHVPSIIYNALAYNVWKHIDLCSVNLNLAQLEFRLTAYQSYRMAQYKAPKQLIMEIDDKFDQPPCCPPTKLSLRVIKGCDDTKIETDSTTKTVPNFKLKIPPNYGLQLVSQTIGIPVVSVSQSASSAMQPPATVPVLKSSDKLSTTGFAQLVQTSTGKHILLTSNPSIPANMGSVSPTGQKLTFLSKQPVATGSNVPQQITKAYVKFQLTSVPGISQTTAATVPSVQNTVDQEREQEPHDPRKTVGTRFISKLYSKSNNLDVRWKDEKNSDPEDDEFNFEQRRSRLALMAELNERRCAVTPIYGKDFHDSVKIFQPSRTHAIWSAGRNHCLNTLFKIDPHHTSDCLRDMMYTPERRIEQLKDVCDRFVVYVPAVRAPEPEMRAWHPDPSAYWLEKRETERLSSFLSRFATPLHRIASAMVTQFPDPRLIQCDCGKLQTLDRLLRKLKAEGHRVLIFTQMTKMLDVLEAFLNYHGHIYLRLDGSTKVDQRQVLMERFNGDTRIFAFILSTRSGGIGVNLTGADTVIFYDSDWNPTMDAQAQDRCHRIGQTRDVNIYRLVSERTIEENILKKANQKRLLGDLAIEGGNFTTAYFKSSTIQDLFDIDNTDESAANRMSEVLDINKAREQQRVGGNAPDQSTSTSPVPPTGGGGDDRAAMGALENALAACEDDQDVIAARTAKAEAVADLAEFDENIPLEEHDKEKEPDISRAEQEVENLIKQLTPVERYAMRFIEETDAAWSAEQLAAAEREIEEQKREWEQNRLAAIKEEQERRARELEEESEVLTYSREDATNQIWVSVNTMEQMPMWCPPTPPQQDTDIYIDHTLSFLYETQTIPESQLPPVYVKKDAKRSRHDAGFQESRRALKIARKDDGTGGAVYAPRSLFERPSPALVKMRRDVKLQKYRGIVRPPVPLPGMKMALSKSSIDPPCWHNWSIHEDMALLKVIQTYQGLPLNLMIVSPGHTPNWDFVADYVNTVSITYRSPKQCRHRYETVLIPREEGKQLFDSPTRKKKNKSGSLHKFPVQQKSSRTMRTSQLYLQDNNSTFSQLALQRYDILKSLPTKKSMSTKSVITNPLVKNPKHTALLNECGIDMEKAVLPSDVASKRSEREKAERERAERAAKEKKGLLTPEMQLAMAQRLHRMSSGSSSSASSQQATSSATSTVASPVVVTSSIVVTSTAPTSVAAAVIASPSTPPGGANAALRTQRIIASPLQTQTVVSVSGLSPAQLQAATQRLIVSAGAGGQAKAAVVGGTTTVGGKAFSQAQLQIIRQQLRLQAAGGLTAQTVKTTIGGQTAVQVQFTQTQPRTQFVRQGPVAVTNKQGITRTVTEGEMVQILKNKQQQQQQQQQQKVVVTGAQANTMQTLTPQVFAQAIQQAGSSGTQVATLVKAGAQTVSIPVTGVTIGTPVVKTAGGMIKAGQQQPVRNLQQFQQQLLAQKKLVNQKIAGIAQVAGKSGVATQVIVGSKPLSTAMTMQQFQQVIRSPLTIPQGPVVLAKGPSRVIPVNTGQGTKQTIQVVAATSQGITTTIRPQVSSSLAGALASIKVQGAAGMGGGGGGSQTAQQTLLSQVSAALQNQNVVRQGSPVRIQTASGTPIVAVTVQQQQNVATQQQQHAAGDRQEQPQQE